MLDHQKGPTFFTLVAATCIIGNQLVIFFQQILIAKVLLIFSVLSWLVIIYTFFTSITIKKNKPTLDHGISGAWLISIVSAQAISILIVFIAPTTSSIQPVLLFSALGMYLVGCILYIYTMSLIFYRLSFFTLTAIELGAPYWINMGATAITTMAGSMLIINVHQWSFLADTLPFVKGFTLFFWFAGTWWIPLLIILGTWRHLVVKVPLPSSVKGYHPTYWGMVFPLGMYTVSTFRLSEALQLDFLKIIPEYFIYIAYAGWIGVMTGLIRKFVHLLREGGSSVAK